MKCREGFILREIVDTFLLVPIGQTVVDFNSMISLSESGAMLWEMLEKGTDKNAMVQKLLTEYEVSGATALADVEGFITAIQEKGLLA